MALVKASVVAECQCGTDTPGSKMKDGKFTCPFCGEENTVDFKPVVDTVTANRKAATPPPAA